jgi:NAD(P)-dependent dehydrogenase (short-subunit alcohol dehydrogenase family)/uncharacterized OB-fold protein
MSEPPRPPRAPLPKPPRRDPQVRMPVPLLPPAQRSRAALGMLAAAAVGAFRLQCCTACGAAAYPPRDACPSCLSVDLAWTDLEPAGTAIAETTVRAATDPYFREHLPWRIGTVVTAAGPSLVASLHRDVSVPGPVRLSLKIDKAGNPIVVALPPSDTPLMEEDPLLRELTAHPRHRRALVTDARSETGQAVVRGLLAAGAAKVFAGVAEDWRPFPAAALPADERVEIVRLDVTDSRSTADLAASIGGKVDILVNTAEHVRPGGFVDRMGMTDQHAAFEVNVHGLARLAQTFGAAMRARGADGPNAAAALVDVLPIHAHANWPAYGLLSATAAARHSLLQCLRAELRPGGIRVIAVYTGPVDEAWRQELPPPKVTPKQIADGVVRALAEGLEEVAVGDVARDILERHLTDPKALEREISR